MSPPHETLDPNQGIAGAIVACFALYLAFRFGFSFAYAEDDVLYFAYAASGVLDQGAYAGANQSILNYLDQVYLAEDAAWTRFRFFMRAALTNHYILHNYLLAGLLELAMPGVLAGEAPYDAVLSGALATMFEVMYIAGIFVLLFAVVVARNGRLAAAVALGLALLFLMEMLSPIRPGFWALRVRPTNFVEIVERGRDIIFLLISPSSTLIYYFPRSVAMVLLIAAYILRWSGHMRAFYAVLALVTATHQGSGLVSLGVALATDGLVRPQIFRNPGLLVAVLVNVAVGAAPQALFAAYVVWTPATLVVLAVAIMTMAGALFWFGRTADTYIGRLPGVVWVRSRNIAVTDVLLLGMIWLAIIPVAALMYFSVGKPNAIYTWGDLPARYLMQYRGIVFVFIAKLVVEAFSGGPSGVRWQNALAWAGTAAALVVAVWWNIQRPINWRLDSSLLAHGTRYAEFVQPPPKFDEAFAYYVVARDILTGGDKTAVLVRPR